MSCALPLGYGAALQLGFCAALLLGYYVVPVLGYCVERLGFYAALGYIPDRSISQNPFA
jgi:hypothetical protein